MDKTYAMINEMRHLTMDEGRKIGKLRMGYGHIGKDFDFNEICYCECGDQIVKTANHVVLECPLARRIKNRQLLRSQLMEIDNEYKNDEIFNNIDLLLFPHLKYPISQLTMCIC